MAFLGLTQNVSLYTVPAMLLLNFIPHVYGSTLAGRDYDPAYPRKLQHTLAADNAMDKAKKMRILRAKAAFENGTETLGYYAAAVVAGNFAGLDVATLNALTLGYLASRVAYYIVYVILQENRAFAPLRSLMWVTGVILTSTLYIKAGLKLNAGA